MDGWMDIFGEKEINDKSDNGVDGLKKKGMKR